MRSDILSSTVKLGQALVVLLLTFVLASLAVQFSNLALIMSVKVGSETAGISYVLRDLFTGAALLLVCGIIVVLIRWNLLRKKGSQPADASVPPPLTEASEKEVGSFLSRFVPGLAPLRLGMVSRGLSSVTRDTLLLDIRLFAPLVRMAARAAGTPPEPEQAEYPSQERVAFVTLAHEEFHQRCLDTRYDATLRALCFVLIMALAPIFIILLSVPFPGEFLWAVIALTPVWFPFFMWVLHWGLHGGSHLLEHLADAHAVQRLTSPQALPQSAPQPDIPSSAGAHVYLDSRGHHPPAKARLSFIRTLEAGSIARLIFFQTLVLFTLAADQIATKGLEKELNAAPLEGVRLCALVVTVLSSLAFSALAGALAPIRHVVTALALSSLFLLTQAFWTANLTLARDSQWLLLALTPAVGQLGGRLFLRRKLTGMLRAGTAPEDLPPRVEHWDSAEEALRLALSPRSDPAKHPSLFQRILGIAHIHGRFFDAVLATGLTFFIAFSLARIVPRPGMGGSGTFLVVMSTFVLAVYFTRWPEQRSGVFVLWGARMVVLLIALLSGALFINLHLYILEQGRAICPQEPALRQLCIAQILMDPQRMMELLQQSLDWTLGRCATARIFYLRCAFQTPGYAIGPVFLASILTSISFDTVLSTLRWLAATRLTLGRAGRTLLER
jgi:hypothetical protein